ncbi:polysaccharide biosynthesis tyrosine autokinase [Modestobacter excelsi]|uniref:polysaccharide biosynthesis tyrosine autokinase n=1 Tax=Modestobacter excelsi TaxID=2213161 RepID=UPI00110D12B3|nr:polysaccharide biosynthesis tyrosine autokinase [Modestobacter excelsi]
MVQLADARRALRARWVFPVLGVLIGLAVAALVLWRASPTYSSTTRVFVSATEVSDLPEAHAAELFATQRLASYVQLLGSERLARGVVEDLDLDETPADVASRIRAAAVPDTVVLEITVTDRTAERAQQLADAVTTEFTDQVATVEQPPGVVDSAVQVTTIEPATFDSRPISPAPARDLSLGGGLGLLLGALWALLPARGRRTVSSADDVLAATGSRPLAVLVEDATPTRGSVLPSLGPDSPDAAALRRLRAHLRFGHGDTPPQVVVVAGVLAGEDRSALAARLALSLAQGGHRVVLVEADLRSPDLARTLALPGHAGLSDVLAGTSDLDSALQPWADGSLEVLTAGSTPLDPSTQATTDGTAALLTRLRNRADVVVVDAAPLGPVPDAVALGDVADGFLLASRFGVTSQEQLTGAAAMLADTAAGLLGVVLTHVPRRAARIQRMLVPYVADRAVTPAATLAHPRPTPPEGTGQSAGPGRQAGRDRVGRLPAVSPEPS